MKNEIAITLIVPCHNEAERLNFAPYHQFCEMNPTSRLCFVDDGSDDATYPLLNEFVRCHGNAVLLALPENQGKAAAVRHGVLEMMKRPCRPEWIGFWDADLETPLEEVDRFRAAIRKNRDLTMVYGARRGRVGSAGKLRKFLIGCYLKLPVNDTQCGAKLFRDELAQRLFGTPFVARQLFDVELFRRFVRLYSGEYFRKHVLELPLAQPLRGVQLWDVVRSGWELARLYTDYRHPRSHDSELKNLQKLPGGANL